MGLLNSKEQKADIEHQRAGRPGAAQLWREYADDCREHADDVRRGRR